jgi:chemotaxis protein MotB
VVPSVPTETRTQQPEDAPHEVSDKQQAQPDALEAKEPHPITPEAKPETPPEQMLAEAAEPPAPQAQEVKPPTSGADQTGGGAQALAEVLAWNGLTEGLLIVATDSQLRMEALDDILFSPASTELTERGEVLLGDLAEVLRLHPGELSIEGHADNRPIHNENYPSNWELSSARAARVVRFLVEHSIPAQRMRAIGYSDTRPKADNTTEDGRTSNRRVTLVLELAPAPSKTALR